MIISLFCKLLGRRYTKAQGEEHTFLIQSWWILCEDACGQDICIGLLLVTNCIRQHCTYGENCHWKDTERDGDNRPDRVVPPLPYFLFHNAVLFDANKCELSSLDISLHAKDVYCDVCYKSVKRVGDELDTSLNKQENDFWSILFSIRNIWDRSWRYWVEEFARSISNIWRSQMNVMYSSVANPSIMGLRGCFDPNYPERLQNTCSATKRNWKDVNRNLCFPREWMMGILRSLLKTGLDKNRHCQI